MEKNVKLLTQAQHDKMLKNGIERGKDHRPIVKLFTPFANCTWLLTEIDPEDPDIAFGLCDLGHGFPELGSISLLEISSIRGPAGLKVERDLHFNPEFPLSVYTEAASLKQRITTNRHNLLQAQATLEAREEA